MPNYIIEMINIFKVHIIICKYEIDYIYLLRTVFIAQRIINFLSGEQQ